MDAYGGFIFVCTSDKERNRLGNSIRGNHACSVVMDNPKLAFGEVELCFFSYDEKSIDHVGLMRRSIEVATAKYNLKFFRMVNIPSLSLEDLVEDPYFYPSPLAVLKNFILRTSNDTETRMSAELWTRFIAYLKAKRPKQAQDIDDLEQLRQLSHQQLDSIGYNIIKQEKEAVLLALKLFGADYQDILSYWVADPTRPVPYLSGLNKGNRVFEDRAIEHDIVNSAKKIVPDALLKDFDSSVKGLFRIKKKNGDTLSMINVNRVALEETTGADLIYYDNTYRSHIMIQYKMMTTEELKRENEKDKNGKKKELKDTEEAKVYYYRPNQQFRDQITRMTSFVARVSGSGTAPTEITAYRLDSNWFYFKLCEPYEFKPISPDLADGIYIPLEYMALLLDSPQVKGPHGGTKISKYNIGRHFPNTFFMKLLEEGLIGSYPETSEQIFAEVEQSLERRSSNQAAS
jgi:hypothetical protein